MNTGFKPRRIVEDTKDKNHKKKKGPSLTIRIFCILALIAIVLSFILGAM